MSSLNEMLNLKLENFSRWYHVLVLIFTFHEFGVAVLGLYRKLRTWWFLRCGQHARLIGQI